MSPEIPEPNEGTNQTPEPAITDADRMYQADVARYGDLSHLSPEQQQKARTIIDGQEVARAAANSNPGGIPGERWTVERGESGELAPGAITEVPAHLGATAPGETDADRLQARIAETQALQPEGGSVMPGEEIPPLGESGLDTPEAQ